MNRNDFEQWLQRYISCWKHNDPDEIGALFAEDSRYTTQAFREPWIGRKAIVDGWLARADQQGNWEFSYRWVAIEADTAVVEGTTIYHTRGCSFHNIWFITLDEDQRCVEFREQWVKSQT